MSNTIITANLLGRAMLALLSDKMATKEVKPASHTRELVLTSDEMMSKLSDLSRDKLEPIVDDLLADCLQKPGRFYPLEMPAAAHGGTMLFFAGIYLRVVPFYDGSVDTSKFQIAVAYY
jgi:hypothetical protein